jgi:hypothetical protein
MDWELGNSDDQQYDGQVNGEGTDTVCTCDREWRTFREMSRLHYARADSKQMSVLLTSKQHRQE